MFPARQPKAWTRAEYDAMVEAGIFGPEDRVELIEGEILTMSPQKSLHATGVQLAADALRSAMGLGFVTRVQVPLALTADSEPEPDIAVVAGEARDYRDAHPRTALLVVEVSDTTLDFDRSVKQRLYARAGIPELWIVNLGEARLEVHRQPHLAGYAERVVLAAGDNVAPLARPTASLAVADLLP